MDGTVWTDLMGAEMLAQQTDVEHAVGFRSLESELTGEGRRGQARSRQKSSHTRS